MPGLPADSKGNIQAVWFLIGPFANGEVLRYLPIYTLPFRVGRRQDLSLALPCNSVSSLHAEIIEVNNKLLLRDLGSTNGTYLNGQRITAPEPLHQDDLVQFASVAFRVHQQATVDDSSTVQENVCDRALALVQFDKMMAEHAVTPFFQPIVSLATGEVVGYEVLARSRLFGLETPKEMFRVAEELNLEVDLSVMLRWEGVLAGQALPGQPHLFLNTHPKELDHSDLIESLEHLRAANPEQPLTLEIHESAIANAAPMAEIHAALKCLDIGLAYDDFGAGQSRLTELSDAASDCVKFDMSLIRGINTASPQRQEVVATLVQMMHNLGITSLAKGVETAGEDATCRSMGFDLGQGFLYGRPTPIRPPAPRF